MQEITLDFETYYSKKDKYKLIQKNSGLTIEQYIRDPRFEIIGLAVKLGDKNTEWLAPHEIKDWLDHIEIVYGWDNVRMIAHNGRFDAAILGWVYNIYPRQIADTMLMSRAIMRWDTHGLDNLTKQLRQQYNWGMVRYMDGSSWCGVLDTPELADNAYDKGDEVHNADGKHLVDFTDEEYEAYAEYGMTDVDLTWSAYKWFMNEWLFPQKEIEVMTLTIEMFTYPIMELDKAVLLEVQKDIHEKRDTALAKTGLTLEDVRSDIKFAEALRSLGVEPPTKLNAKGQTKYAFAKTDRAFQELADSEDEDVANLVAARLNNKSSQVVTRVKSFIEMSDRGNVPIPIEYYAAHTGRWGGSDRLNPQNLNRNTIVTPSTKKGQLVFYKGKADRFVQPMEGNNVLLARHGVVENTEEDLHVVGLRDAFKAPKGKVLVVLDLSQIELRMNAYVSGEQWVLDTLVAGKDIYKETAARSFGVTYDEVTKSQRYIGKQQVLLLGYGGGESAIVRGLGKKAADFTSEDFKLWVNAFRAANPNIVKQWKLVDTAFKSMIQGVNVEVDHRGIMYIEGDSIVLPNGMRLVYRGIKLVQGERGFNEIVFWGKDSKTKGYNWIKTFGGRGDENCIAEDTKVLTDRGWVAIQDIKLEDKVFDGVEFTTHGGILFKSEQTCVNVDGVFMTEDHEVLTNDGWKQAGLLLSERSTSSIQRLDGATIRKISCFGESKVQRPMALELAMRLWKHLPQRPERREERCEERSHTQLWLLHKGNDSVAFWDTQDVKAPDLCRLAFNETALHATEPQSVAQLWWSWDNGVSALVRQFRAFSGRYVSYLQAGFGFRSDRQQRKLRAKELPLGRSQAEQYQQTAYCLGRCGRRYNNGVVRLLSKVWSWAYNCVVSAFGGCENATVSRETKRQKKVYDILNCGPRHRFVVLGDNGPFIVHNCIQALSRIILSDAMVDMRQEFRKRGWDRSQVHLCMQVHDEVITCCDEDKAEEVFSIMEDCLTRERDWARGLPLACDGDIAKRYGTAK